MSLNLLNPQVGDIIGVSSETYDEPIVEFPIGRFIIVKKERFKPGNGGYSDRRYTCQLLWQKHHYALTLNEGDSTFTITLKEMINSYHRYYLHYRPEGKEVEQSGLSWENQPV